MGNAPAGACILYAISCNLSDRDFTERHDVLSRGKRTSDVDPDADAGDEPAPDEDDAVAEGSGGAGSRVSVEALERGEPPEVARLPDCRTAALAPLIDQAHRLMHLWRAGVEAAKVNDYLDDHGLKHHALFARLLQALIELSDAGSEERAILESLSNHIAARGGVAPARQARLHRLGDES